MKPTLFLIAGATTLFAATALLAENAVILEGFETNIDSVTQGDWGGSRIPDYVSFEQYTKSGPDDINVTEGQKSLKVNISGSEGWVLDFKITLSDEASAKLREALAATNDIARYILRYDLIFPSNMYWMNNEVFLGDNSDQLDTPSGDDGGKATMSLALDLITGVPEEGPIVIRFGDNFDCKEDPFVGPVAVYVDNIRLVDTYAPGAKAVTYMLQSFEDPANPTGGATNFTEWGGTPRTTYSQYTKDLTADPPDIKVTDGNKSLKVDYVPTSNGEWKEDFQLPFAGTKLAEVLKLDLPAEQRPTRDQLARYTLRFDIIYPDRDANGQPSWCVTTQFAYDGDWFPYEQARIDSSLGQAQTRSITLDQLANWSATVEGAPVLVFVAQGDFDNPFTIYYDNFRLIDTGAGTTPTQPKIDSITVNAQGKLVITWTGGGLLQSTPSLANRQWTTVAGATSGSPIDPPSGGTAFYRIMK